MQQTMIPSIIVTMTPITVATMARTPITIRGLVHGGSIHTVGKKIGKRVGGTTTRFVNRFL